MPELGEIYEMTRVVNGFAKERRVVGVHKSEVHKSDGLTFPDEWKRTTSGARLFAVSRGKELVLCLAGANTREGKALRDAAADAAGVEAPSEEDLVAMGVALPTLSAVFGGSNTAVSAVRFNAGMTGMWLVVPSQEEVPKHGHLVFEGDDGACLVFDDMRRLSRWYETVNPDLDAVFAKDRGPDPVKEPEAFAANIEAGRGKRAYKLPICQALLNQKYFNGVGNYLRAEILHRSGVSPFDALEDVLDSDKGPVVIRKCTEIPAEIIRLGLGIGYKPAAPKTQAFKDWLQVYGMLDSCRDKTKRTIWFDASIHTVPEQYQATLGQGKVLSIEKRAQPEAQDATQPKTKTSKVKTSKVKTKVKTKVKSKAKSASGGAVGKKRVLRKRKVNK